MKKGMKIGDIDARCETAHCYTISDKALAIGGAALEAVELYGRIKGKYGLVILAAGRGERFGGDKLSSQIHGRPVYQYTLDLARSFPGVEKMIVTGNERIAQAALEAGVTPVENREPDRGISWSLKLGLKAMREKKPEVEGILFCVCDQPGLRAATIQKIWNRAAVKREKIICAGHEGRSGNPVLWPGKYFPELMELEGDVGGAGSDGPASGSGGDRGVQGYRAARYRSKGRFRRNLGEKMGDLSRGRRSYGQD